MKFAQLVLLSLVVTGLQAHASAPAKEKKNCGGIENSNWTSTKGEAIRKADLLNKKSRPTKNNGQSSTTT